jgi:hypothetical protein
MSRPVRNLKRFELFPEDATCPVCGTNDDGETVLLAIDGTSDGRIAEAKPTHLACAVLTSINIPLGIAYRRINVGK